MTTLNFPCYKQLEQMDCGPTCLKMILRYYGKTYSTQSLRDLCNNNKSGATLNNISNAAESLGFKTLSLKVSYDDIIGLPMPSVLFWKKRHFIVLYNITKQHFYIADPAFGKVKLTHQDFKKEWLMGDSKGIVLLLEPTNKFQSIKDDEKSTLGFKFLFGYLIKYKKFISQLIISIVLVSIFSLISPFLSQSLVDIGIVNSNIQFVYIILISQLIIFLGQSLVEYIRSWLILHLNSRIYLGMISDFLYKLLKLPLIYFEKKKIGDIIQRLGDHGRVQNFLTFSTLNILFSLLNLIIFGIILILYNKLIFAIYLVGSFLSILWLLMFMKKRKEIDYLRFSQLSNSSSNFFQLVSGINDIKLFGAEKSKRLEWESIQSSIYNINIKSLILTQYQDSGIIFFNQLKNIFISFVAALSVINGEITLGMMMAISYIIGQLNGPINQIVYLLQSIQDTKISLERIGEVHNQNEEDKDLSILEQTNEIIPSSIIFKNISFKYDISSDIFALKNINCEIKHAEFTAIVGSSGSGKSSLLKLLLKYYEPTNGNIFIDKTGLDTISTVKWRKMCGVVMQDGYLFSDTIANNIALGIDTIDKDKLESVCETVNINSFIKSLPLGFSTEIGTEGHGLSQGQKKRILIARSLYRSPKYLFFDEPTSDLDTENENIIMLNLIKYYPNVTKIIIAHRMSTIREANKIIVLDNGEIVEEGCHEDLLLKNKTYYNLVKKQL